MSDLIKALEADMFGAYEWSAELYEELAAVPEAPERLLVMQGLFRAYDRLSRPEDSERAASRMAEAEAAVPRDVAERFSALVAAREALLDATDTTVQAAEKAPAFLALFDEAWARPPRDLLLGDAIVAALTRMNLLAGRMRSDPTQGVEAARPLYREAADLYAAIAAILEKRAREGERVWHETAAQAWHRARSAWRAAGDEHRARVADEAARGLAPDGAGEASEAIREERAKGRRAR